MPALTPNRSYPYPVPTDPLDVPGDIERLAQAVNDDVTANVVPATRQRAIAKMRASTPQTFVAGDTQPVIFDITRMDTDGMTDPVNRPGQIIVQTAGLYCCQFTALIPANVGWSSVRFSLTRDGGIFHTTRREYRGTGYPAFTYSGGTILQFAAGEVMELRFGVGNAPITLPADRELAMWRTGVD